MKQLSSFMVLNLNGSDRISFTYDEIDNSNGDLISSNNKKNFFIIDNQIKQKVNEIRQYIYEKQLND